MRLHTKWAPIFFFSNKPKDAFDIGGGLYQAFTFKSIYTSRQMWPVLLAGSFAYTKRMADYQIWRLPKSAGFNTWLLKEMAESKNWPDPKNDNRSRMADSQIWLKLKKWQAPK